MNDERVKPRDRRPPFPRAAQPRHFLTMTTPKGVILRWAVDDSEALAHLHTDVWEDAYSSLMPARVFEERRASVPDRTTRWRQQLIQSAARTTVAADAAGLIGFVTVGPPRADDVNVDDGVYALYVRAAWWNRGLGHALLTSALGERPAVLWVLNGNDRSIAFYRKHGLAQDGVVRTDHYGTELRMARA